MRIVGGESVHTEVIKLIEDAEKAVILVSPYVDPWKRLVRAVEHTTARGVQVVFVFRGGADLEKQWTKLGVFKGTAGVVGYALERLHAKLYVSDKSAILTSMNLLGSSALDSHEAAVVFEVQKDPEGYRGVAKLATDTLERARVDTKLAVEKRKREVKESAQAVTTGRTASSSAKSLRPKRMTSGQKSRRGKVRVKSSVLNGHCIRCKATVGLDVKKPLCPGCYATWAKFKDVNFGEKHCHCCGKAHRSSVAKPVCRRCYTLLT